MKVDENKNGRQGQNKDKENQWNLKQKWKTKKVNVNENKNGKQGENKDKDNQRKYEQKNER